MFEHSLRTHGLPSDTHIRRAQPDNAETALAPDSNAVENIAACPIPRAI